MASTDTRLKCRSCFSHDPYERARLSYVEACHKAQAQVFESATAAVREVLAEIEITVGPLLDKLALAKARQRTSNNPTSLPRHELVLGEFPTAATEPPRELAESLRMGDVRPLAR